MATRVTGPNSTTPEAPAETVQYRDDGGRLVTNLGPNRLDGPRIRARLRKYDNTQDEQDLVRAYDEAAFDRVRPMEQAFINQAEELVSCATAPDKNTGRPGFIAAAEVVVTELNDIVTALERGAPANELAARFKDLQNQARQETLPHISRTQESIARSHLPRVEDPYAAVQNSIAKLPYSSSSFRDLNPSKYLK